MLRISPTNPNQPLPNLSIKQLITERLASTRKDRNMTLRELAEQTGEFSVGRISNWEQASRSPGPAEAKLLAEVRPIILTRPKRQPQRRFATTP